DEADVGGVARGAKCARAGVGRRVAESRPIDRQPVVLIPAEYESVTSVGDVDASTARHVENDRAWRYCCRACCVSPAARFAVVLVSLVTCRARAARRVLVRKARLQRRRLAVGRIGPNHTGSSQGVGRKWRTELCAQHDGFISERATIAVDVRAWTGIRIENSP